MNKYLSGPVLLLMVLVFLPSHSQASQCVDCHTDAARLKTITDKLPKPEASAETAGKG